MTDHARTARNFLRPCGTGALPSENSAEVSWECPRRLSPARRARGILEPVQSRPITAVATAVERRRSFSSFGGSSNFNVEEKHSVSEAAQDFGLVDDGEVPALYDGGAFGRDCCGVVGVLECCGVMVL